MKWTDSLTQWRKSRNITAPQGAYVASIQEELDEYTEALNASDEHEMVDALADIMVFTANEMALMGYNLDLVMKQVVKEISSRQQSPSQAAEWSQSGPSGKWQKDVNQDPSILYKANFSSCKLASR